jgi:catechol 2,3-dioxygenase-like lactoylglutathione lyase family enzyme
MRSPHRLARALLLMIACAAVAAAAQQPQPQSSASPPLAGIAHVALRVSNLDASRAFYKRLGFEEAFALDQGGSPTEAFIKVNDTQFIELYPQRQAVEALGFLHVCYLSHDIEALNQFYRARGLSPTEVARGGAGNLLFSLHGPGLGNIEFTQYMPGSRHTNDIGQHLGEHRIAIRIAGVAFPSNDPQGAITFHTDGMAFPRIRKHGSAFRIPGSSADTIEILRAAEPLRLVMEVNDPNKDLKHTALELRNRGIAATRRHAVLVLEDPDGNTIELKQAPGAR